MIDLGAWSQESFRIPVVEQDDEVKMDFPVDAD